MRINQRQMVRVTAELAKAYECERRAIDARYPHFSEPPDGVSRDEHWRLLAELRTYARAEIRRELLEAVKIAEGGDYIIAV